MRKIDNTAKVLAYFIKWLLGKLSQSELAPNPRTFRDKTQRIWSIWSILPVCNEIHHVVFMDGLWLARGRVAILIACTSDHVIGCHLTRTENSRDWACLMQRVAPPDVLARDGGGRIGKTMHAVWPSTRSSQGSETTTGDSSTKDCARRAGA